MILWDPLTPKAQSQNKTKNPNIKPTNKFPIPPSSTLPLPSSLLPTVATIKQNKQNK